MQQAHRDALAIQRLALSFILIKGRETSVRPITILYAEDNRLVLNLVKDTLELEGWQVDICEDGTTALKKIEGAAHYDLLLLDHDLPGVDGLALVGRARELPHRQDVPIAMLSASQVEEDARLAGADEFLRKPEDISRIVEHLKRLLDTKTTGH
jgi:CheY-like chemotaxis protein